MRRRPGTGRTVVLRGCGVHKARPAVAVLSARATARLLPAGGWYPGNRAALRRWLAQPRGKAPTAAAFDFDNTCICGDIGDATFRQQLAGLQFRLPPEAVAAALPAALPTGCADLAREALQAYRALWAAGMARHERAPGSPAHVALKATMGALYQAMDADPLVPQAATMAWVAALLRGFNAAEVAALAVDAWEQGVGSPPGVVGWEAGHQALADVAFTFRQGLRLHEEMRQLMAALAACDVQVFVVTASHEEVVRAIVRHLGLPVDGRRVLGMRPEDPQAPVTYGAGKVAALRAAGAQAPAVVAGDANTDYAMLTEFAATELRLVLNRNADGPIGALYAGALARTAAGRCRTLLQGRDENTGALWPHRETRPLGARAPWPLRRRPRAARREPVAGSGDA